MQHVLIIGKVWPEPISSAAGSRMLQLINLFLSQGWQVSFATPARESEFMSDLDSMGVHRHVIELNSGGFDLFVKNLNPQIVLFDRFTTEEQFGWRVAENCPDAMRILDTEDLHCLRSARQTALNSGRAFKMEDLNNDVSKRELASIYRCDLSLIISDFEMEVLASYFKVDKNLLHYVPFMLEPVTAVDEDEWPSFSERADFISIGNFLHEPNWDAVLYLKKSIWPLIRKELPEACMHISGAYPSHKVFELHDQVNGFLIKGRAASVNEAMIKARVCLAPLRFGAGLKGKLVDAIQSGTPSVTTAIGAEAMHGSLEWSGIIADTPREFAMAAITLYTDKKAWKKAQHNGIAIINNFFSRHKHEKELLSRILTTQQNLEEHRAHNFTGAMLMYHSSLGTRYMSLWIEAKNKLKVDG
jgi:glycosyltransferase involved in cell wall biosynthesis